jgi:uncharacterized protein YjiS (DUF1127 family)
MQYGIEASADEAFAIVDGIDADAISSRDSGRPSALQALSGLLLLWWRRFQERRELAGLSEDMLRDVGLDRSQAWQETSKPFWRA